MTGFTGSFYSFIRLVKLHNQQLHNLYSSPNITVNTKKKSTKYACRLRHAVRNEKFIENWSGILEENTSF